MGMTAWDFEPVRPGRLRISSALTLYRRRLRRRRWIQDLLAILGIAAGVALLYATQVASTSLSGPVKKLSDGIVGAGQLQLLARGATTIPASTYDDIMSIPGVERAAPVLQIPGNIVGPTGEAAMTFYGADPRLVKLNGSLVRGFSSRELATQETVIVPAPIARRIGLDFGNDVRIQLDGRSIVVPAVVADRGQIGILSETSVALLPLTYLQRLARIGPRVTRVLVEAAPHRVDEVRRGLAGLGVPASDVRPSTYDAKLFDQAISPTTQASAIFSGLSALVGWLFAICALLVTASDRRKLVVQQRRQGFPPSATLTTLLVDAAIIGGAGVVLGLAAGEALSREGFRSDVSFLSGAFAMGDIRVVTWQSIAIAVVGGLLAAVIGVLAPVHRVIREAVSARAPAVRENRPTFPTRPATILAGAALVSLAGAVIVTVAAPNAAVVGLLLLAVTVTTSIPLALSATTWGMKRLNARGPTSSAALALALHQLNAHRWRARGLAIATTGAIAVFGAMSLQGARANLQYGLDGLTTGINDVADIWVTAPGAGSAVGTTPFSPRNQETVGAAPGVAAVVGQPGGLLDVAGRRVWVMGAPDRPGSPIKSAQLITGRASEVAARLRRTGWVTLSQALAGHLGLSVGDRLTLPTPRPLQVHVAAITTNLGWSAGAIVLSARDFVHAWGNTDVTALQASLRPGVSPAQGRDAIAAALGKRRGLLVETAAERAARQSEVAVAGLARLRQIATLTLLAAILAMSTAMIGLLWQHRPIIASHKFLGMRTTLLWRSLIAETGVLFGVGVLVGFAFGLLGQVLCTQGVAAVTGFPVVHALRLGIAAEISGAVLAASLLVVCIPGYLVARSLPSARS